jgi:YidC/Oxa1 family membrane protein insertase
MIVGGILTPIENALTWVLEHLHTGLGLPWAWAIVALTVMVRMLLVPLTVKQIHSMQRLQRYAPQMKELQQKYKHDKERQRQELTRFYQENQINPAASCLPLLLQLPIFFSLYFVLRDFEREVFPQYPQSDLGWLGLVPDITKGITDHWSGYLLLVIYLVSQVSSMWFMPTATVSRAQRIFMMTLPLVFVFFIIDPPGSTVFPVGLLLYWMTTNLWTVGQGLITRRLAPKPAPPPRRTSRTPAREEPAGDVRAEAPAVAAAAATSPRRVKRKKKKARR